MREPIVTALEHSQAHRQLYKTWQDHHPDAKIGVLAHSDNASSIYHQWETVRDERLSYVYNAYRQLRTYLTQDLESVTVKIIWSHVLEVHIGSTTSSQGLVVIELSMYGPLAATYFYRTVPKQMRISISSALQTLNIIELLPEEIDGLEEQGLYQELF